MTTSEVPVLLTGPAGTGKSSLVSLYLQASGVRTVVLGSTGVSALQLGGQTVHAYFRLPPRIVAPGDLSQTDWPPLDPEVEGIVCDEVSMLRGDVIDAMDVRLRRARRCALPFGGVRLLFVGDPLQLPPVLKTPEAHVLREMGYRSQWFFDAHVFRRAGLRVVELDQIHRQLDPGFARLLSRVRSGRLSEADRGALAKLVRPTRSHANPPLILATTRKAAHGANDVRLDALDGPQFAYWGQVRGAFPSGDLPVPKVLRFKPQARVLFVRNDPLGRWANGSQGTVLRCGQKELVVRVDNPPGKHVVHPVTWEYLTQRYDRLSGRVVTRAVGWYTQVPTIPGWAVTIHRSQGMTIDHVRVDLGNAAFTAGQTYVALSRVRSREGLELVREVRPEDVWADPRAKRFLERAHARERAHEAA